MNLNTSVTHESKNWHQLLRDGLNIITNHIIQRTTTMNILIAPGAFKHSLSARAAAEAIARGLRGANADFNLRLLPIADGGNGTLDAFLANGGRRVTVTVEDPLGRSVQAEFGLLPDGKTAVIEMALASGLELVAHTELDPMRASTYGTGQLLGAALDAGAKRVIVGMGGSATVDGGAGCVMALGAALLNNAGQPIARGGRGLSQVNRIATSGIDARWRDVEVIIATDVENPVLGPDGAAAVYGPQKGATPDDVPLLESGLAHFFDVTRRDLGVDVRGIPGGGAAGALAAGLMAFLNGRIAPGVDLLLAHSGFESLLSNTDLVITGEGQMDEQTIYGKGPVGVARLAAAHGVPTVAIVGGLNAGDALLHEAGIWAVLPIVTRPMTLDEAIAQAESLVERAALRLGYLLQVREDRRQT